MEMRSMMRSAGGPSATGASLASDTADEQILKPEQILTFQEVTAVQEQTLPAETDLEQEIKTTAIEGRDHNIKDFLERVYKIADGVIPVGGASGEVLDTFIFPDIMLGLKQIANKISGFYTFRAFVEVTFVLTAQPAQLGGLRLTYLPDVDTDQVALRAQHYLQLSQAPHITINIAKNQNSSITLPWISPYTHRNLVTGVGRNGYLVLSRLTPSAGGAVNYQMYAKFTNISIEYPTGLDTAEEAVLRTKEKEHTQEFEDMKAELAVLRDIMKTDRFVDIRTQGLSEATGFLKSGVLSQTAGAVSGVANMLSGIPVIGNIASAVSPIAGALANIFSSFGWSKPVNDTPPSLFKQMPGISTVTSDGVANSHEFTICTGNTVQTDDGSYGSSLDEMSIDFIMRAPNTIDIFPISTEMPAGTVLARYNIDLMKYFLAAGPGFTNIGSAWYMSHQTAIATLFRYWMGTCVFDFEAFMTKFHNVRLRFAVIPGATSLTDLSTVTIDDNNSSVVVFGDTVNYQAKCPEVAATPFLFVAGVNNDLAPTDDETLTSIGQIVVFLEVPLKATSEVAPTTVYVETKFHATNVRLGYPSQCGYRPVNTLLVSEIEEEDIIRTQGLSTAALYPGGELPGRSDLMETGSLVGINSDGPKPMGGILHSTFGEMIKSIKQIMLSYQYFGFLTNIVDSRGISVDVGSARLTALGVNVPNQNADIIDALMSMYAFTKGGFNLRVITSRPDKQYLTAISPFTTIPTRLFYTVSSGNNMGRRYQRQVPVVPTLEGLIDLRVPYYQGTHITRVSYDTDFPANFLERFPVVMTLKPYTSVADPMATTDYGFQRAVADDFSLGFLYAPAPISVSYNSVLD